MNTYFAESKPERQTTIDILSAQDNNLKPSKGLPKLEIHVIARCFIVVISTGIIYFLKDQANGMEKYEKISDTLHIAFTQLNTEMNRNPEKAQVLQLFANLMIDLNYVLLFGYFIIKQKTGRFAYSMVVFYLSRFLIQKLIIFPYPEGLYWSDGGFPSLTVSAVLSNDFFWSGHCGFLTLVASEWLIIRKTLQATFSIICLFFTSIILLIFRAHYTADIVTGIVFAHYIFIHITKITPILDRVFSKAFRYFFPSNKFSHLDIESSSDSSE